ncbi:MAG TPA: TlpA disulfide reductase family protein [Gaiellales bacterium]|jgi:thiol-disulfide isomerase/thioredoxin|nr:TlpA disulfide reductase family protein [Gaiellales bacterium]
MSRRLVAGLVALIAIGGVFAYGLSHQGDVASVDTKHVTVPPSGFQTYAAAAIDGTTLDQKAFSLAGLHGKPVFINFWGSWCPGCKTEAPDLRTFANDLGGRAAMVGVAIDSPSSDARSFIRKAGWRYPIVSRHCCDLVNRYGVAYFPTTIVVNSRGQVVDRLVGPQTVARLQAELHALGA